ncbi:putative permease binding-protein component [Serinicoccus hydrothermalis]|uniref:Putative permease binding-protein component n=1 Tax=Serinicoccus hydrothermalis TaxID=1758689 RepID=A0A1B1NCX3_9MICO|nr:glycine betaine ABC transporter substrate-binding protein [Serinicoccus hydrothermalis]ANS79310.1 putative permease binding-protein component [Serinicoccus hydrothermalis]
MAAHRGGRGRRGRTVGAAAAALAALGLTGCGLGTGGGFVPSGELAGPLADVQPLDDAEIAVGSKNFSEQLLVGKMAVILFKSAGAQVQDYTNIPGSSSTRQALLGDELDMVWEYTGTAWIAYLGETDPIPDEQEQWQAVKDADAEFGLTWLPPAPMNNTYGFAMTQESAEELGITKLSEIQDIPEEERTFCVESEFNNRNDGFDPMLETYDIPRGDGVPEDNVRLYDTGAIYAATAQGDCTFGEVFTTDGRIQALDLVVLEDDRDFFPAYNLAPVVQEDVLEQYPQIEQLFAPVSEALTDDVLLELNARIDVDGQEPGQVAFDWLVDEGFITDPQEAQALAPGD